MRSTPLALALIAAAALVGCGGGDNKESSATPEATATEAPASSGGGGATLAVSAPKDGSLKFDQSTLTAKAGKVEVKFSNPSSTPHAVEIEGNGVEVKTDVVTGKDATVSADLKPGEYEFYCPVGSHRAAGMEGKLTVQ